MRFPQRLALGSREGVRPGGLDLRGLRVRSMEEAEDANPGHIGRPHRPPADCESREECWSNGGL